MPAEQISTVGGTSPHGVAQGGTARPPTRTSQHSLGVWHANGLGVPQDYAEAGHWYHKAAEHGHAEVQHNLGYMYEHGQGVPPDYAEAGRWYLRAADHGAVRAQYNLGALYYNGQGVPQDYLQAYMWASLAVAQGDANAAKGRDLVATKMSPAQIEQAKALAAAWKPTTGP